MDLPAHAIREGSVSFRLSPQLGRPRGYPPSPGPSIILAPPRLERIEHFGFVLPSLQL